VPPLTFGVKRSDQVVPFQLSARVTIWPELLVDLPTARHALVAVHTTPERRLSVPPVGSCVGWIDQLVPFQLSASVSEMPEAFVKLPTAWQSLADVHETPERRLSVAPTGFGVDCIDQLVPFQLSARPEGDTAPEAELPTASQSFADGQDTPENLAAICGDTIDQVAPFQSSARAP